jgi:cysteinyl-tRNA synthetase
MDLKLYNTATRKIEKFEPLNSQTVTMYNCGPTVYNYAHIGNLRAYVFADVLRRTLELNGYDVKQIINITDVGHLVSDGDEGEDKMEVARKREGKSIEEIIEHYADAFIADLKALNVKKADEYPNGFPRASAPEYIAEQKKLVETLAAKDYTYIISDGIYFDTSKFPRYADFARLDIAGQKEGARVEANTEKRNPTDFALWKFSPQDGVKREQEWDSPLVPDRKGFPGWHIECSAIVMKELGETIDIHTGGIDHIPVHHTNEIAQSESATGKQFARFWMHSAFMTVDGQKMSKSIGNTYTLWDIGEHNVSRIAYRYWLLTAHYRTQVNFTWESLEGAGTAYHRLYNAIINLGDRVSEIDENYRQQFSRYINDDLNTPAALALIWDLLRDEKVSNEKKLASIFEFDNVLGLGLKEKHDRLITLPSTKSLEVMELVRQREEARKAKDWIKSDLLRDEIKELRYEIIDTPEGPRLFPLD